MGHYDEQRERHDNQSKEDKLNESLADQACKDFVSQEYVLKELLLQRYMRKHTKVSESRVHSKSYWDNRSKEVCRLIKKLKKKEK